MKRRLTFGIVILLIGSFTYAQDFEVAPKAKSLEVGYRYIAHTGMNIQPAGWVAQGDIMWQVSGFKKKRPSFISIPIGFSRLNAGGPDTALNASILHYGWTIKHNLARDREWIPYLCYSLLMNQMWQQGREGRVMGHETRFDFGYEYHPGESKLYYYLQLEYSHISYPALGVEKTDMADIFSLKLGLGF